MKKSEGKKNAQAGKLFLVKKNNTLGDLRDMPGGLGLYVSAGGQLPPGRGGGKRTHAHTQHHPWTNKIHQSPVNPHDGKKGSETEEKN